MLQLPVRLVSHRHLFSNFTRIHHASSLYICPSVAVDLSRRSSLSPHHCLSSLHQPTPNHKKVISSNTLRPTSQMLGSMSHIACSTFCHRRSPLETHFVGMNIAGLGRFFPFLLVFPLSQTTTMFHFVFELMPAVAYQVTIYSLPLFYYQLSFSIRRQAACRRQESSIRSISCAYCRCINYHSCPC